MKSILDVPATLQRLETLGVAVAGYGTDRFPGFYLSDSGHPVDWRLDTPAQVAEVMRAQDALGGDESALIVAQPRSRGGACWTPNCTRASSTRHCARAGRRGHRPGGHAVPARPSGPPTPTAPPSPRTWRRSGATSVWPRGSRRAWAVGE
ncbi:hypothetical protein GCM10023238_15910 [Streptomyces heliomycini]